VRRLLICSRSHVPEGGADRIIADLCRHLPIHGWDVRLGLTQGAVFNDVDRYLDVLGRDLPALSIDGRAGSRKGRLDALAETIRRVSPDVVLSMRVFDAYEAVIRAKSDGGKAPRLAVGLRSFEPAYLGDLSLYRESVDLVVTSGELLADLAVEACGIGTERVVSIGGGVHAPLQADLHRVRGQRLRLLYAGRLEDGQKRVSDLPLLLDALDQRGVAFELHVAGSGPAEATLRQRMAARIASGEVVMHGWVSRDTLYQQLYPQADVFLHFAGWEGMTIAPREAMVHGVVPVISRFQGLRREGQFVDGETAMTFEIGDIATAAECVARLDREPSLLARLSEAGRHTQSGKYEFGGSIKAWADALDNCMDQPVKRGTLPVVADRSQGRLSRAGLTPAWEARMRRLLRRPVKHRSPGSEWPTSSGMSGDGFLKDIQQRARSIDERAESKGVPRADA